MAILTESAARNAASRTRDRLAKSAATILKEEASSTKASFDIFLSHSVRDSELVLGVSRILQEHGKSVYVDWVQDRDLDRSRVSADTADRLRMRMKQCEALFYLYTDHSTSSRWMPWELGYFDALKGNVAILPVQKDGGKEFKGEEYLGLYPFVDFATPEGSQTSAIFVNRTPSDYKTYGAWVPSSNKMRP